MTGSSPVEAAWTDAWGRRQVTTERARRSVLATIGADERELTRAARSVEVAARGRAIEPGELTLEDGTEIGSVARLPRDLPFGYHRLRRGADERLLLVAPPRCPLPGGMRSWGWAVQLYALRSARSWGIGDLDDLRRLADWSSRQGAGALLLSPLGAANPAPLPEPSPYYPSSRRFRDPIHLAVEQVPGYDRLSDELAPLASEAQQLNGQRSIRRGEVQALKLRALERIWDATRQAPDAAFVAFEAAQGDALRRWGLFAALSEEHGPGWHRWPSSLHDPAGAAARRAAERLAERIRFHAWLQWLLDRQLRRAGRRLRLVGDLPIGFDPGGFDAWTWQAQLADASLGAPPDVFNPGGQRWDLPPFIPHRLQLVGYAPFIETIRAAMGSGGGLRIDHVLGLFRQWWVPRDADAGAGAYVRQPTDELLAVLAIEAERAGAIVIGEDLGTVAPGIRRRLASANVLSTRLAFFERRPPARWPHRSLAAVTTHDLPTTAGAWSGIDLDDQRRSGVAPNRSGLRLLRQRLARVGGVPLDASMEEMVEAVHTAVAAAPSVLATCTLEDAVLEPLRPNMPGTGPTQRDNWSRALSMPLERIVRDPLVRRLAGSMQKAREGAG